MRMTRSKKTGKPVPFFIARLELTTKVDQKSQGFAGSSSSFPTQIEYFVVPEGLQPRRTGGKDGKVGWMAVYWGGIKGGVDLGE